MVITASLACLKMIDVTMNIEHIPTRKRIQPLPGLSNGPPQA